MDRLKYEAIDAGWEGNRVVTGFEVVLSDGWRGAGETLDEAVRAAELARSTHEARVARLSREAARLHRERYGDEIPF